MDVPEDQDVKLQRSSTDLLLNFRNSLPRYLWSSDSHGARRVRKVVRQTTTEDLLQLLRPFQEWPQLLDPQLSSLIPPLIDAFLDYLEGRSKEYQSVYRKNAASTLPLPGAICRLLYEFCKIRGVKVISRFFSNEPKYLEPMLDAFEQWNQTLHDPTSSCSKDHEPMVWEERYIMLYWLSHLLLTPFDLASITSASNSENVALPSGLNLPMALPLVAVRIISLAIRFIYSSSKERESSVALLARIALRPDMHRAGLLDTLVSWAQIQLMDHSSRPSITSIYAHVGLLSFIVRILNGGDTAFLAPILMPILQCIQKINGEETLSSKIITTSAVGRKLIIKIYRSISLVMLRTECNTSTSSNLEIIDPLLEEVIEHLLTSLADKDTPVRLAASKALSMIVLELEPSMAAEVVEAVVGNLEENVLWDSNLDTTCSLETNIRFSERDLTAVNPLRWHGLILTLSHLLYRRSPPPDQLPAILKFLLIALGFEQRSAAGNSVGASVRDAACFGIWSLARRYTTQELLRIRRTIIYVAADEQKPATVLQVLANHLLIAASLDASGNIRRGASAALQELVGRHPDTVTKGIDLVQVVDYHAVALRSRAMRKVALDASTLSYCYWTILLEGLLSRRGIGSLDTDSRRLAASTLGSIVIIEGRKGIELSVSRLLSGIDSVKNRDAKRRHGLLLGLEAIVEVARSLNSPEYKSSIAHTLFSLWKIFQPEGLLTAKDFTLSVHRPELTAEAACSLIFALSSMSHDTLNTLTILKPSPGIVLRCVQLVKLSLARTEDVVVACSSKAAGGLFNLLDDLNRDKIVKAWIEELQVEKPGGLRAGKGSGLLAALGAVFHLYSAFSLLGQSILDTLLLFTTANTSIEARIVALKSLTVGVIASNVMHESIAQALLNCLCDYTNDQRGDVGSLVRIEALGAVSAAWQQGLLHDDSVLTHSLIAKTCSLAVEKLDKVRFEAWRCLRNMRDLFENERLSLGEFSDMSSSEYYLQMLSLSSIDWISTSLLEGYVTSAGIGSDSVLRASRAAFVMHAEELNDSDLAILCTSLISILESGTCGERLAIPVLEFCTFLFDAGILERLVSGCERFSWHSFAISTKKIHYKSGNIHRLRTAIDVYTGLAAVPDMSQHIADRLFSFLSHPFPKIRNDSADALYILTENPALTTVDWSKPPKDLKKSVAMAQNAFQIVL